MSAKGAVDKRLLTTSKIIVSYAAERYGYEKRKEVCGKENRREEKIKQCRRELKALTKRHKTAGPEVKKSLQQLCDSIRAKMKSLGRAESHRRRRKERARKRMAFISNPFGFTKELLGEKQSGRMESSTEEIDAFLKETLKDPNRLRDLEVNTSLITPTPPSMNFDLKEPTWIEIQAVMKKARLGSALGPNGVPYIVYKR